MQESWSCSRMLVLTRLRTRLLCFKAQSRPSLIPLSWEWKGMSKKKTKLEHYFSIKHWVFKCISLTDQSACQRKPSRILKQHPVQDMQNKMGWHYSRNCQCIISSSFSQIASAILLSQALLAMCLCEGFKMCPSATFKNSIHMKAVHLAGCELPNCHAVMCDDVLKWAVISNCSIQLSQNPEGFEDIPLRVGCRNV